MDPTHLHLLLNHFPTIGFIVGITLFLAALVSRSAHLKQASLAIFVMIALITIPTYVTGNAAELALLKMGGVSRVVMQRHEVAAMLAFVPMQITGMIAWFVLWRFRRTARVSPLSTGLIVILAVVTLGLIARAANLGGDIRHTELRLAETKAGTQTEAAPDAAAISAPADTPAPQADVVADAPAAADEPTDASTGEVPVVEEKAPPYPPIAAAIKVFAGDKTWAWPALETLHFIGLALLMGVMLLVNLRMLGIMKQVSFAAVDRLLPWGMLGFAINTMSGMLFFVQQPASYAESNTFYGKLLCVLIAGANVLYFTFDRTWDKAPGEDAPFFSKLVAVGALLAWVGVMYFGSMLPFLGTAF